jgi:hypothetical protein
MAKAKVKLNTEISKYLSATTPMKLGARAFRVGVARIDDAVLNDAGKPVARYTLIINGKQSKYLLRSWQGAYQVHQVILAGDGAKMFTKSGDLKASMPELIGTDKLREEFAYVCPIGLYNNNQGAKKAVNIGVKAGTNFKKDNVWESFLTFPTE